MRARWLTRFGRTVGAVAVATGLLASAACGAGAGGDSDDAKSTSPGSSTAGFPRQVEHAAGTTTLEKAPERVVALDMTFVDATLALETQVVGYTTFAAPDEPLPEYLGKDAERYAKDAKPVGLLEEVRLEQIIKLKPDLILSANVRHGKLYNDLSKIAPTVFTETTGATWKENLELVGRALGKEKQAEQKLQAYTKRAKAVGDSVRQSEGANPTVSIVRFVDGPTRLYKEDTYVGVIVNDLGFDMPKDARGTGFNTDISPEEIKRIDADDIFLTAYPDPDGASKRRMDTFRANPLWKRLKGGIHEMSDETWMSAVGLYGAQSVLDDIARTYDVDPARG